MNPWCTKGNILTSSAFPGCKEIAWEVSSVLLLLGNGCGNGNDKAQEVESLSQMLACMGKHMMLLLVNIVIAACTYRAWMDWVGCRW